MSSELLRGNRNTFLLPFVAVLLFCLLYVGLLLGRAFAGEWSNATTFATIPLVILIGGVFVPLLQQLREMNRELRRREDEKAADPVRKA